METVANIAQIVQNFALVAAVVGGGCWALFRYRRFREERLSIEFTVSTAQSSQSINGRFIVSLLFVMRNKGSRALKLVQEPPGSHTSPLDVRDLGTKYERIAYRNCEMLLWRLQAPTDANTSLLSMTNSAQAVPVPLAHEPVNLLETVGINPNSFWFEPAEVVHLTCNLALPSGYYAGVVRTVFRMRPIVRKNAKHTFDVFSFAFEVLGDA